MIFTVVKADMLKRAGNRRGAASGWTAGTGSAAQWVKVSVSTDPSTVGALKKNHGTCPPTRPESV
jgi:hypothetical protein